MLSLVTPDRSPSALPPSYCAPSQAPHQLFFLRSSPFLTLDPAFSLVLFPLRRHRRSSLGGFLRGSLKGRLRSTPKRENQPDKPMATLLLSRAPRARPRCLPPISGATLILHHLLFFPVPTPPAITRPEDLTSLRLTLRPFRRSSFSSSLFPSSSFSIYIRSQSAPLPMQRGLTGPRAFSERFRWV